MSLPTINRFKIFYFFIYVSFTTHHFLNLYFRDIGLSGEQIGVLKAVSSIIMIFSQPIWGFICDFFKMRKGLLNVLLFFAGVSFFLVPLQSTFSWILFVLLVYGFFKNPIVPVADSIVMLEVKGDGGQYSQVRLWGAVGLTLSVVFMGYYFNYASLRSLFFVYMVFTFLALLVTLFIPRETGHFDSRQLKLRDFAALKSKPGFIGFLVAILFMQTGAFIIDGFFGLFVRERIGNEITLGWALTLAGFSEIVVYHYLGKLKSVFSARQFLIISAAVSTLRWFLYAYSTTVVQIFLLQLLHGISFGFFYISAVTYVNQMLPREFSTSGQTLLWANAFGLAAVLGSLIGGVIYDNCEFMYLFITAALLTAVSLIVFIRLPKIESA